MTAGGRPPGGPAYRAQVLRDWPDAARTADADGLAAPTPFQGGRWLDAWYATLGAPAGGGADGGGVVTPLPVLVREARAPGRAVLLLPLVLRADAATGRRVVEFADRGVTDYNAPLLGPGAPGGGDDDELPRQARELWRAVRAALPPADLALLARMPPEVDGRPNPLARLPGVAPSTVAGHVLTVEGDDFAAWRRTGLAKPARKELERSWRVFLRHPGAAFRRVTDPAEAGRVYADLVRLQRRRATENGLAYALDGPDHDRFYRRLLETGLADGSTILTALTATGAGVDGREGEARTVAALLGVADGRRYVMVRICDAGDDWKACSPGRVLIERTLEHLHRSPAGYRVFDFGLGDYAYKRRFGVTPLPLVDLTVALSARGLPRLGRDRAKALVRRRPALARAARRAVATAAAVRSLVLGGPPPRQAGE